LLLVGREAVEQQVDGGVGHGAAAPPDVSALRGRRLTPGGDGRRRCRRFHLVLLGEVAAAQLLLPLTVGGRRPPGPLQRGGEVAEPLAGHVGRRRHRGRRHGRGQIGRSAERSIRADLWTLGACVHLQAVSKDEDDTWAMF